LIPVLYVDDESALLDITKIFLERSGEFSVDTATSAKEAIGMLMEQRYDAIISDFQMPEMNGIEFLKKIRTSGNTIPFIIFTGKGREEVVIQALNEGADFYLQKGGELKSQFAELSHKIRQSVQQRRAEISIRELERRETDIINFLPDATFAIDTHRVVIAWNRAMEKMTGIRAAEILGKGNYEYALPFYRERRPILIDLVLRDDPATTGKYQNIIRDQKNLISEATIPHFNNGKGASLWFIASPLYDTRGAIVGAIESIREITDRKRAEESLKSSEERYRKLLQRSFDAVVVHRKGIITLANQAAATLVGASSPSKLIGKNILDFVHPAFRDIVRERIAMMTSGDAMTAVDAVEEKFLRIDGKAIDVEVVATGFLDEGQPAIQVVFRDITRRKELMEALNESEERYRNVVETQTEFICRFKPDGTHIFVNEAYCRYFNKTRVEMIGNKFIPRIPKEEQAGVREHFASLTRENPVAAIDHRIIMPDGQVRWQRWNDRAIFDDNGILVEYQSVGRDITDRIEAEEALRRKHGELSSAYEQLTAIEEELRQNYEELARNQRALLESEEWYRTIFENTGTATVIVEENTIISLANSRFLEFTGYSREEIEGEKSWTEFVVPEDLDRMLKNHHERRREDGSAPTQYEFRFITRTGEIRSIFLTIEMIPGTKKSVASLLDITDRKNLEMALRESEERYRALYDENPFMYFTIDAEGIVLSVNPYGAEQLGYSVPELLGQPVISVFYPDDRSAVKEQLATCLEKPGEVLVWEFRKVKKDRTVIWVREVARAVTGGGDKPIILIVCEDITEAKRSEEALAAAERLHRAILSASPVGIGYVKNRMLDWANEAMYRMVGYQEREIIGRSARILYPDDSEFERAGRILYSRGDVETRWVRKDGTVFDCLIRVANIDPSFPDKGVIAAMVDITEQKRVGENLRESEAKYRTIIENLQGMFYRTDRDGNLTMISPYGVKLAGYNSEEEMIGLNIARDIYQNPEERKRFLAALTEKGSVDNYPLVLKDRHGTPHFVTASSHFYYDDQGNVLGIEGILHDITEQKKTEVALAFMNKKLNLMSSITRHDILNQLTALSGSIQLASVHTKEPKTIEYLNYAEKIIETIQRQIAFTTEYEDIGIHAPVWQPVSDTVRSAVSQLHMTSVTIEVTDNPVEIYADPLLEKVFLNLIHNALQHGEKVTTIRFSSHESDRGMIIVCEDDGVGISRKEKKHLFERGFGKHTGFGLYLVREILSITGITIRETGEPGKGARFEILVPKGAYRFTDTT
jgi:PAS domain S-box-containing protein